jgi:uncharacterized damage-inducible protein DinB
MNVEDVRRLFAYTEWANALILEAIHSLTNDRYTEDLRSSFPSIRDTLAHLVAVEWVWLQRWKGESPRAVPEWAIDASAKSLEAKLHEIEGERRAFIDGLSEADLQRPVAYTNFKGERWEYPLGELLTHLANHSTYHRGQLTTMLRQVGAKPASTDLLLFLDQESPHTSS